MNITDEVREQILSYALGAASGAALNQGESPLQAAETVVCAGIAALRVMEEVAAETANESA